MEEYLIAGLFSLVSIVVTYILSFNKYKGEITKLKVEINKIESEKEETDIDVTTKITEFYEQQAEKLLLKVNQLSKKVDDLSNIVDELKKIIEKKDEDVKYYKELVGLADTCNYEKDKCPLRKRIINTEKLYKKMDF